MIDTFDLTVHRIAASRLHEVDFNNIQFGKVYSDHIFDADYFDGDWRDFRIVPYGPLHISPANVTLHYGHSVFEGMKAHKNENDEVLLFRPLENFKRLNKSAERLCLQEIPQDVFMGGLQELINLDRDWVPEFEGTSLYIRPVLFATDEYIGIRPSSRFRFMIITCPVGAYYSRPVKVCVETKYSRAAPGGTGFAKAAGNYAGSMYPAKLAQEKGYDQLLWTDAATHKYIEESGTMNVMFYIDDTLITPLVGDTILDGITRDSVLTIARDMNIKVEERPVSVEEIIDASKSGDLKEAFGTGTAATIAPISTIGLNGTDYELPSERPISEEFKQTLDSIKTGKIIDRFNWTIRI